MKHVKVKHVKVKHVKVKHVKVKHVKVFKAILTHYTSKPDAIYE